MNKSALEAKRFIDGMADALKNGLKFDDKKVQLLISQHIHFLNHHGYVTKASDFAAQARFFLNDDFHRNMLESQQTIHDFDFSFQPSISEKRVKETLTCRFIANGENRILLGPPGVGKTHLAISFAIEAITQGYTALFLTADDLVAECRKANKKGTLQRLVNRWGRPDVLIIPINIVARLVLAIKEH
ncbi:ATP-binding protein [Bacillus smithii]|uniref:IstB-like ATP-binding domain-containing protein n=1 Tax=Bacillus smithii 7_3_47FAA TaxID=665952 RepID=G9QGU2_9BACI|nr:ATP-binding protein [Bacillus smithii]EHL79579.1 hypothetical protein HMPREF1015_01001 [Bacillus smithii 7_3_47FAA]